MVMMASFTILAINILSAFLFTFCAFCKYCGFGAYFDFLSQHHNEVSFILDQMTLLIVKSTVCVDFSKDTILSLMVSI